MTDIVDTLNESIVDIETNEPLLPGVFGHCTVEDIKEAVAEIERLREKCNRYEESLKDIGRTRYGGIQGILEDHEFASYQFYKEAYDYLVRMYTENNYIARKALQDD